jgi:hypothetical protein
MNDNEKFVEEYVKGIPFEDAGAEHRDVLKAQLLNAFGNPPHAARNQWATRLVRLAAAAVLLLALSVLISQFSTMWSQGSIVWADVAKKFQSVPFFNAVIYMRNNATAEPKEMDLWWRHDGRTRVRMGTQVIFGVNGRVARAFDVQTHRPVEPDEMVVQFLRKIVEAREFSLNAIIDTMFGGHAKDVTPQVNADASISHDLVVFDVELPSTPEWVRIWALRESHLPIRIRIWHPSSGRVTDAVFEYSKGQSDTFFDPNAFGKLLSQQKGSPDADIAQAFLTEPGRKGPAPGQVFEKTAGHVPEIEQIGITPDGAVWVIANRSENRMPNNHTFRGFEQLHDDLGRRYYRVHDSWHDSDRSTQVFVPSDYPFDKRVPTKLTLVCQEPDLLPDVKPEVIGTVELTQWSQGQLWPEGTVGSKEISFRNRLASTYCGQGSVGKAERILATVEGRPEDDPIALDRDRVRLDLLVRQDKCKEAAELGDHLMPLLEEYYCQWHGSGERPTIFCDYILALGGAGKLDQARQTWSRIKNLQPEIPDSISENGRKSMRKGIEYALNDTCLRTIVPYLYQNAHLTIEQINTILGIDIRTQEVFKGWRFWEQYEKPPYKNWERHLAELAEYYRTHPLPEQMEILKHTKNEEYACRRWDMPGIDGYSVSLYRGRLKDFARWHPGAVTPVRVEAGADAVAVDHDLICKKGVSDVERTAFLLDYFGWETVETKEPRKVWVAHYDGRPLKDYRDVLAPLRGRDASIPGTMVGQAGNGFALSSLLHCLMMDQDPNTYPGSSGIIVIDETGIGDKSVSKEQAAWRGPKALEPAKKWFADEFGVTFTEETWELPSYTVRKKR